MLCRMMVGCIEGDRKKRERARERVDKKKDIIHTYIFRGSDDALVSWKRAR